MRSSLAAIAGIAVAAGVAACGAPSETPPAAGLSVTASFYPLTYLAEEIGGDRVQVADLTPAGGGAHDLELSPGQVGQIGAGDLILYLSGGFQPSVEAAIAGQGAKAYDGLLAAGDRLREGDSHVWLDPSIMAAMGEQLAEELGRMDPDGAASFAENAAAFRQRMEGLDRAYAAALVDCRGATLVASHEAFGYLADAYGLRQVGIAGINPEAEPSPKRLREVSQIVAEYDVGTLFFEQATSAATEKKLADSLGIAVARLQTLESPPADGASYEQAMESNLRALQQGLACGR